MRDSTTTPGLFRRVRNTSVGITERTEPTLVVGAVPKVHISIFELEICYFAPATTLQYRYTASRCTTPCVCRRPPWWISLDFVTENQRETAQPLRGCSEESGILLWAPLSERNQPMWSERSPRSTSRFSSFRFATSLLPRCYSTATQSYNVQHRVCVVIRQVEFHSISSPKTKERQHNHSGVVQKSQEYFCGHH